VPVPVSHRNRADLRIAVSALLHVLHAQLEEDVVQHLLFVVRQIALGLLLEHAQEIDRCIQNYSKNWRLERIAKVELTVLRLAVYEMLHHRDVPPKVAINEGIELSKTFGDPKSGRFVNGILDGIAREQALRPKEAPS